MADSLPLPRWSCELHNYSIRLLFLVAERVEPSGEMWHLTTKRYYLDTCLSSDLCFIC